MKKFNNKVIWITGASSGIGEQLAYEFVKYGAKVIISARNEERLEYVRKKCNNIWVRVLPVDLTKSDHIEENVIQARNFFGRIDYMIHNAGVAQRDYAQNTGMVIDRMIMEVNYFGPIAITKALLPSMIEQRGGHFVSISSLSGKYGVPQLSAYSAAKHALHGFFESLRAEVAKRNIKISVIVPGFIKTGITIHALTGNGCRYKKMGKVNEQGMSAAKCARNIVRVIHRGKEEALIGGMEICSVYFKRFFPYLWSLLIRNHPIKMWRNLKRIFLFR